MIQNNLKKHTKTDRISMSLDDFAFYRCFPDRYFIFNGRQVFPSIYALVLQVNYVHPSLPNFFIAEGDQLTDAATRALQCLDVEGSAGYMIIRDEVALARSYNIVYGLDLEDLSQPYIVGGVHPSYSKLPCCKLSDIQLDQDKISTVSVVSAVKRLDKRTDLFAIQHIPRSRMVTAETEFREIGLLAES